MKKTSPSHNPLRKVLPLLLGASFAMTSLSDLRASNLSDSTPQLSSRPGAEFTVYLDVSGFTYDGFWAGSTNAPGTTLGLNDRLTTETFNSTEQDQIKALWSRMAQSYIGFNVNVTTVDPTTGMTDAARQAYYDATPNFMHTIVGSQNRAALVGQPDSDGNTVNPSGKWYSTGADGVSQLGVITGVAPSAGNHTNWMFSEEQTPGGVINGDYIGAISAHENAHAFGLYHQGDWTDATKVNEYTNGDDATGNGSYVAIIGNASNRQRVAWRVGDTGGPGNVRTPVNDVKNMLSINSIAGSGGRTGAVDLHLVEDGIGHTGATATTLSINLDKTVNFTLATGVIVPTSETDPNPIGVTNYTQDWFTFKLSSVSDIILTANNSTQFLVAGVADGVGTLRSTLEIFNSAFYSVGNATEDVSTLFTTFSGNLGPGVYYAKIGSFGGHQQITASFNAAQYYDMGAFFLTGSGFNAVPEPGTWLLLGLGVVFVIACQKRRKA